MANYTILLDACPRCAAKAVKAATGNFLATLNEYRRGDTSLETLDGTRDIAAVAECILPDYECDTCEEARLLGDDIVELLKPVVV